ncbi:uncharacterized protein LOC129349841 isoform X2 [Amphiprion ocellaris]|uniref:uncharacterized protein LOC129349841 isoform X2 n=1 Tax=Amphiprion ocellaris TaxID=80972 RepID=UPI002410EC5E|nr:uncharacterized protein LOC129349841 isoform X2 [Amphiprion ocellaris]
MSSVLYLRELISERLTAAAEEIFTEFEKIVVQYEEEIDRQRRLLDVSWKPDIKIRTISHISMSPLKKGFSLTNNAVTRRGTPIWTRRTSSLH